MGSGELTSTMVQAHKDLLARRGPSARAVFLDTPAGFELNADQISRRVADYFRTRLLHDVSVASFRSRQAVSSFDAAAAFRVLEQADYILMGPGSPTYALRQWQETPVPDILARRILAGACLTAASAAALTVGRCCLPVYEIYKVGEEPFWAEGLDILGRFGIPMVVVPHWNNAEGGTFDTRFCFMGEPRFRRLESLLPEDIPILGIDEHTACILDFGKGEASVRGIGSVTLRRKGADTVFRKGDRFPIRVLREGAPKGRHAAPAPARGSSPSGEVVGDKIGQGSLWDRVHGLHDAFQRGMEQHDPKGTVNALLELDRTVWEAQQDMEPPESISQARELLRELLVQFGVQMEPCRPGPEAHLAPLVEELLERRETLRRAGRWEEADGLRDILHRAGVVVEDTPEGARWHLDETAGKPTVSQASKGK